MKVFLDRFTLFIYRVLNFFFCDWLKRDTTENLQGQPGWSLQTGKDESLVPSSFM